MQFSIVFCCEKDFIEKIRKKYYYLMIVIKKNDHFIHALSYNVHAIKFQLNRVCRPVKPCEQMSWEKNRRLHKFTTCN